jgi:hypothetical protein
MFSVLVPSTADLGTGSMGLILLFLSTLVLLRLPNKE